MYKVKCIECEATIKVDADPKLYAHLGINRTRMCKKCKKNMFAISSYKAERAFRKKLGFKY